MCSSLSPISTVVKGTKNAANYRVYFRDVKRGFISPFHDIPLRCSPNMDRHFVNMVVEIPRWTNAKLEICKAEPLNPIKQDVKKGNLRFVDNIFPYHGYIWNYGAIPQTYEDPNIIDPATNAVGDDDPLDVIEVGTQVHQTGDLLVVKVIGAIALIDEGETDWKVIAIDRNDPLSEKLNRIEDIERVIPGLIEHTIRWFRL
ncbi:hypothetical protein ACOME3_001228 [Neoechinorhynchus agilis]